ncbi:MAG: tryptophan halogenase family protein [Pacificibacter sp.]|uniref:tryptophan halogenase family protein n=1 Tax=Pacificibacter sp. TaxID=1917866 RepID=UPI00321B526B
MTQTDKTQAQKHIAIVGGGTAGWLTALVLQKSAEQSGVPARLSVIESPNIPTVGVGEGSTSIFRQVLLDLGFDEAEFLRETGATFKFGIHHEGWRKDGGSYFGPIDDPNALGPVPDGLPSNWLHQARIGAGKDVAATHLFTWLMRGRKSPYACKKNGDLIAVSPFHYAYHFDQSRLGRYLASKAQGIDHIRGEVAGVQRDAQTGDITSLQMQDMPDIPVDLVIDCTGFRRALIGQLEAGWVSYGDILPLNKAMPFWLDHDPKKDIAPYTQAKALGAGWMWGIPVQDRMGCGYVFSDAHCSEDQAQQEVEATLRQPIEVRRVLSIAPGRLNAAWVGNCIAIGLAQSFLEPLEATSIHGSLVQALMISRIGLDKVLTGDVAAVRAGYNATVARQVDDFAQFINLHYAGGREDTEFWRAMTATGLTAQTQDRLQRWSKQPVLRSDFTPFPGGLAHVEEQLYTPVLDGLGLLPQAPAKRLFDASPKSRALARKTTEKLTAEFKTAARSAIGHRAFFDL